VSNAGKGEARAQRFREGLREEIKISLQVQKGIVDRSHSETQR
jgi:hypothetical protein